MGVGKPPALSSRPARDRLASATMKPGMIGKVYFWQTWWVRLLTGGALTGLLFFVYRREVTRLKRDKRIQQEFSRQQIESQEVERRRLASELHDGLGQNLLIMNNELQQFLQESKVPTQGLQQVASVLQESIEGVREISSNLHPHVLDRLGFHAAVSAMSEALSHSSGIVVEGSGDDIDHLLPKETELAAQLLCPEAHQVISGRFRPFLRDVLAIEVYVRK